MTTTSSLQNEIAALVERATDGLISATEALDPDTDLQERGMSSLGFLQLVDAIENTMGVYVDLEQDITFMRTVAGIAGYVETELA